MTKTQALPAGWQIYDFRLATGNIPKLLPWWMLSHTLDTSDEEMEHREVNCQFEVPVLEGKQNQHFLGAPVHAHVFSQVGV